MSTYAPIWIGGVAVAWLRNGIPPEIGLVFQTQDVRRVLTPLADLPDYDDDDGEIEIVKFVISQDALRDRLDCLGFGYAATSEMFNIVISEELTFIQDFVVGNEAFASAEDRYREEMADLRTLDLRAWQERLRETVKPGMSLLDHELRMLMKPFEELDRRYLLSALVGVFEGNEVELDITELIESGWIETEESPRDSALGYYSWSITAALPVVVLTEGKADRRALLNAVHVLKPHLDGFVQFLDYDFKPDGGASALAKMVRAFAAARVGNRIIALFDNDTAGSEAIASLPKDLPPTITVTQYPELPLATEYPTLGPTGETTMDVNGLAGSIELYLGEDVLRDEAGDLRPVQWTGFNRSLRQYQGEVAEKGAVQAAFEAKVAAAKADPGAVGSQNWAGLQSILEQLLAILASSPDRTD